MSDQETLRTAALLQVIANELSGAAVQPRVMAPERLGDYAKVLRHVAVEMMAHGVGAAPTHAR